MPHTLYEWVVFGSVAIVVCCAVATIYLIITAVEEYFEDTDTYER